MKRVLAVVLIGVVAMLAPSTHSSDDNKNRVNANSEYKGSTCSSQAAANPSYIKCSAVAPFSLGATGVALPNTFCQSADCYAFWSGLTSENIAKCMSGYKVGSIAVSNASGMTECFTNGGGLRPATATTIAPPPKTPTTPSNASETTGKITLGDPKATAANMPQGAPDIVGASDVAVVTPTVAKATGASAMTTTGPSTVMPSTPASPKAGKGQHEDNEEVEIVISGSGSSRTATKIKKRTNTTGGVVEEAALEDDQAGNHTNSTTKGARISKSSDVGSQSGSLALEQDRDDGGSSPTSVWVASGGSGGGVLVVIFLFVFVRKRKSSYAQAKSLDATRDSDKYLATLDSSRSQPELVAVLGVSAASNRSLPSSRFAFWDDDVINAVRIPFEKLVIGERISRGAYGEVHRGMYRGQPVAIKSLLPERRKEMRQIEKFITEVKLMAVLEHEHIVRFIGVAWDSLNELCVVSAFMTGGDLRSLLARYEANERAHPRGFDDDKTKIAMHVAHALTFMHSLQPPVLHRDLKSRNILLDTQLNAHLTDFGISRECGDGTMTTGVGSSLWMAPEVMRGERYDEKADVFSFGVVLSELDVQTLPYANALEPGTGRKLPDTVVVQMMITGRICVQFTLEAESPLAQLGRQCVALDSDDRPTAAEVQHRLHQLWRNPSDSL